MPTSAILKQLHHSLHSHRIVNLSLFLSPDFSQTLTVLITLSFFLSPFTPSHAHTHPLHSSLPFCYHALYLQHTVCYVGLLMVQAPLIPQSGTHRCLTGVLIRQQESPCSRGCEGFCFLYLDKDWSISAAAAAIWLISKLGFYK